MLWFTETLNDNLHMTLEKHIPLLEDILDPWQQALGKDFLGYKNHVYRVVHFCLALHANDDQERDLQNYRVEIVMSKICLLLSRIF
jgi:hypothetical protein